MSSASSTRFEQDRAADVGRARGQPGNRAARRRPSLHSPRRWAACGSEAILNTRQVTCVSSRLDAIVMADSLPVPYTAACRRPQRAALRRRLRPRRRSRLRSRRPGGGVQPPSSPRSRASGPRVVSSSRSQCPVARPIRHGPHSDGPCTTAGADRPRSPAPPDPRYRGGRDPMTWPPPRPAHAPPSACSSAAPAGQADRLQAKTCASNAAIRVLIASNGAPPTAIPPSETPSRRCSLGTDSVWPPIPT